MKITNETLVGEVVRDNFTAARIFDQYGIDFCCGGDISIEKACIAADIDAPFLIRELHGLSNQEDISLKFVARLPPLALCEYIIENHHRYVREQVPFLRQKLNKLCEVHGEHHPELWTVSGMFATASSNLLEHMEKEETLLFPMITELALPNSGRLASDTERKDLLKYLHELKEEHQAEGDRFREMARITTDFSVPGDGCNTFQVTYRALAEFVVDLHRHIHLENNILFPETIRLNTKRQNDL